MAKGPAPGDEGRGYWLSMKTTRAIAQVYDHRIGGTALTRPVPEHLGLSRPAGLPRRVHSEVGPREGAQGTGTRLIIDSGTVIGGPAIEGGSVTRRSSLLKDGRSIGRSAIARPSCPTRWPASDLNLYVCS